MLFEKLKVPSVEFVFRILVVVKALFSALYMVWGYTKQCIRINNPKAWKLRHVKEEELRFCSNEFS